jgi:uncharacterized ferredoxin-like protein
MNDMDIITDRLLLIADILQNVPRVRTELFSALDGEETAELRRLLDKLTDKSEEIFTPKKEETVRQSPVLPEGAPPLGENEIICADCEMHCRVSWTGDGKQVSDFTGARCQCGIQAARQAIAERNGKI